MWKKWAQAIANDDALQKTMRGIKCGWSPNTFPAPYDNLIDELTVTDGVLFRGSRIVVPDMLQKDMLKKIH